MQGEVKIGFCVAYDWTLLRISIPLIYKFADKIFLAIDQERVSWAGNKYFFDEDAFTKFLQKLDIENKVEIIEDNFFVSTLNPMENEVRQRNIMADIMGKGGWHIQLDCDEYFLNFNEFIEYLKNLNLKKIDLTNICCPFITLFKKDPEGYFIISKSNKEKLEYVPIASSNPNYKFGRRNGFFNHHTKFAILHQSWAHDPDEIELKMKNWGHLNDFDGEKYYAIWNSLNKNNYRQLTDFHPINPQNWPDLKYINSSNINELIEYYNRNPVQIYPISIVLKNSRLLSKIKSLFK